MDVVGRRWVPLFFLPSEPLADGLDVMGGIIREGRVVSREVEYRMLWDAAKGAWRMDYRVHAEGG